MQFNHLEYSEREYDIIANPPIDQRVETIAGTLGSGAVLLRRTSRREAGIAALAQGAAYQVFHVDGQTLRAQELVVVIRDLLDAPESLLVYTDWREIMVLPELVVEGAPPRDVSPLMTKVLLTLEAMRKAPGKRAFAAAMLGHLTRDGATPDELSSILTTLDKMNKLPEFFSLATEPEFRTYLRRMGVDWDIVFSTWQPTFEDRGRVFAGIMFAMGENALDVLVLLANISELPKVFSELLAAAKRFFEHPVASASEAVEGMYREFQEQLWNLDFFEAGRSVGMAAITLLTLPEALVSMPRLAQAAAKLAAKAVRVSLRAARSMGVTMREIVQAALTQSRSVTSVTTGTTVTIIDAGEDLLILSKEHSEMAVIAKKDVLEPIAKELGLPSDNASQAIKALPDDDVSRAIASVDEAIVEDPSLKNVESAEPDPAKADSAPKRVRQSLDEDVSLSDVQKKMLASVLGKTFDTLEKRWLSTWNGVSNPKAEKAIRRIAELFEEGTDESLRAAKDLARDTFDNWRDRFWRAVQNDDDLKAYMEHAGLTFPKEGAPYLEFKNGAREKVTIEHAERLSDDPRLALVGENLMLSFKRENSGLLEQIRRYDEFQ